MLLYVQTLVSSGALNTSASITETDEGVATDDQSQLTCQDHLRCTKLHVSSVHQELLKKNEQLKLLRQMLKEVLCITHLF